MEQYTEFTLKYSTSRRNFLLQTAMSAARLGELAPAGGAPESAGKQDKNRDIAFGKSCDGAAGLSYLPKFVPIAETDIKTFIL